MPIEYMTMEQELLQKYNIPVKWADCTEDDEERYIQYVLPIILHNYGIMSNNSNYSNNSYYILNNENT